MAHVVHVKRLLWEGWDAEQVSVYTTAPVSYVEKVRDGIAGGPIPWPNGKTNCSLSEAKESAA